MKANDPSIWVWMSLVLLTSSWSNAHDQALHAPAADGPESQIFLRRAKTIAFYEQRVAEESEDLTAWSKLGPLYLELGRATGAHQSFRAAEQAFQQVQTIQPSSGNAAMGIAYARLGRHEFQGALKSAREAARVLPDNSAVCALLGDVHFALGHYSEAQFAFQTLDKGESTFETQARLALLYQVRGRYEEAGAALEAAKALGVTQKISPAEMGWCESMLGDLAMELGQGSAAEEHYLAALALAPGARSAVLGVAQTLEAKGQLAQAIPLLEHLVQVSPEPKHRLTLAKALDANGDPSAAQAQRDQALASMEADLESGEQGHVRELVLFWLENDGPTDRAVELALQDLTHRRDVETLETAAWALYHAGQLERADELIREALQWGGKSVRMLCRAAAICEARGDSLHAERLSAQAAQHLPRFTK